MLPKHSIVSLVIHSKIDGFLVGIVLDQIIVDLDALELGLFDGDAGNFFLFAALHALSFVHEGGHLGWVGLVVGFGDG